MKKIKIYQVDAFTDRLFSGNPAAVCILKEWLSDDVLQSIAAENNLAETAFIVPDNERFIIRWFTPSVEVELCGHATLATAHVLFKCLDYVKPELIFYSPQSGILKVSVQNDTLFLDFPTDNLTKCNNTVQFIKSIGIEPKEVFRGRTDYIVVVDDVSAVQNIKPDFREIAQLDSRGLAVTARGEDVDFVSRFFAPQCGIDEDPVTGSAHTSLIPIWYEKLGKTEMAAKQISKRGGNIICSYKGDRCLIGGKAKLYMTGEINLE